VESNQLKRKWIVIKVVYWALYAPALFLLGLVMVFGLPSRYKSQLFPPHWGVGAAILLLVLLQAGRFFFRCPECRHGILFRGLLIESNCPKCQSPDLLE